MEKEPKMNEGLRGKMTAEILDDFDFEKVQAIMVLLGITFPDYPGEAKGGRHVPSVDELKTEAKQQLEEAWIDRSKWNDEPDHDKHITGVGGWCGHLMIDIFWDGFEMKFQPITSASYFEDNE